MEQHRQFHHQKASSQSTHCYMTFILFSMATDMKAWQSEDAKFKNDMTSQSPSKRIILILNGKHHFNEKHLQILPYCNSN